MEKFVINIDSLQEIKRTILNCPNLKEYYWYAKIRDKDLNCGMYKDFDELINTLDLGKNNTPKYFFDNIKEPKVSAEDNNGFCMANEGFAYDMQSVIDGTPECCIAQNQLAPKKQIKIKIVNYVSWYYSPTSINNRAIAIANFINSLIVKGYIVSAEIYWNDICERESHSDYHMICSLKLPTNIINVPKLAYIISPEFYRGVSWLFIAIASQKEDNNNGSSAIRDRFSIFFEESAKKNELVIEGLWGRDFIADTLEDANKSMENIWNKFVEVRNGI